MRLKVLLITNGFASNDWENISSLLHTTILVNPDSERLNQVIKENEFDILHIVGDIQEENPDKINLDGTSLESQDIINAIKTSEIKLVFLGCRNSVTFATHIFAYCDTIFVSKRKDEKTLWQFTYHFYRILIERVENETRFRPRASFQDANYYDSGFGYLSTLNTMGEEVEEALVIKRNVIITLEFKTLLVLLFSVLITLVTIGISFLTFLLESIL